MERSGEALNDRRASGAFEGSQSRKVPPVPTVRSGARCRERGRGGGDYKARLASICLTNGAITSHLESPPVVQRCQLFCVRGPSQAATLPEVPQRPNNSSIE